MPKPLTLREALLSRLQSFAPEYERLRREGRINPPPPPPSPPEPPAT